MYLLGETEQRVRTSLRDAILLLCQTGLKFNTELSIDGLLAVTLDKKDVFLLSIKETLQSTEPSDTIDDSACLCRSDDQAVLNFSSVSPSASFDDRVMLNVNGQECNVSNLTSPLETPNQFADDAVQLDTKLLPQSDQLPRRRQRKQRRTVRRLPDSPCPTTSPSAVSVELSDQPDHVLGWTGRENGDLTACSDGGGADLRCNNACKTASVVKVSDQLVATPLNETSAEQRSTNSDDQKHHEAIGSLRLDVPIQDDRQCESETLIDPVLSDKELVTDLDRTSKRSHCKRRHTVERYLEHGTCPISNSSSESDYIPGSMDRENGEALIFNEVEKDGCKVELSNTQYKECQDLPGHFPVSADVKTEIVEPALSSTDIASQLSLLGHNIQPSSDPQQQMAMMSQFGLSAVVARMQSHFALLPKPFPWSVRTLSSLSPPSIPTEQCAMVGIQTFVVMHMQGFWSNRAADFQYSPFLL